MEKLTIDQLKELLLWCKDNGITNLKYGEIEASIIPNMPIPESLEENETATKEAQDLLDSMQWHLKE
jgi:hypothetical protein